MIYASVIAGASFSLVQALGNVKKQLLSPCLLAMFAAVALRNGLGLGLPGPAVSFLSSLAVANKPLALLALGVLFEPALRGGQLRDVASLLALRYGAGLLLGAALLAKFASAGPAVLGVVLAALISPVPLLTVTYAVEYECDVGLGAAAVNAANFCSFALLMAVANADLSSPATVRAFAAAGAALAALGAFGARRDGAAAGKRGGAPEDTETAVEAVDVTTESREREGDGGSVLRAIARSSSVSRVSRTRPVRGLGSAGSAAPKKCVSPRVAAAPPRASAGLPGRSGTHEGRRAGGFHEPSRRFSVIAGSRARAVVGRDSDERVAARAVRRLAGSKNVFQKTPEPTQNLDIFHFTARHASLALAATAEIPFATASAAFAVPRPTEESASPRQEQGPGRDRERREVPRWRPRPKQRSRRWGRAGRGTRRRGRGYGEGRGYGRGRGGPLGPSRGATDDPGDEELRAIAVNYADFRRLKREKLAKTHLVWANTPSPSPSPEREVPPAAETANADRPKSSDARNDSKRSKGRDEKKDARGRPPILDRVVGARRRRRSAHDEANAAAAAAARPRVRRRRSGSACSFRSGGRNRRRRPRKPRRRLPLRRKTARSSVPQRPPAAPHARRGGGRLREGAPSRRGRRDGAVRAGGETHPAARRGGSGIRRNCPVREPRGTSCPARGTRV